MSVVHLTDAGARALVWGAGGRWLELRPDFAVHVVGSLRELIEGERPCCVYGSA